MQLWTSILAVLYHGAEQYSGLMTTFPVNAAMHIFFFSWQSIAGLLHNCVDTLSLFYWLASQTVINYSHADMYLTISSMIVSLNRARTLPWIHIANCEKSTAQASKQYRKKYRSKKFALPYELYLLYLYHLYRKYVRVQLLSARLQYLHY